MSPLELNAAVLAALDPPAYPLVEGEVLDDPGPDYAVLWPGGGRNESTRLSDHANRFVWTVRVMAVSESLHGCLTVADWVRARLDRLRVGMHTLRDDSWDGLRPLLDGPANHRRYSLPLDFTIITTRSTT